MARLLMLSPLVSANGIDASTDANAVLYADNISVTPTSTNDQTIAGSANFNQENYTFGYGTGDLTVNRRAARSSRLPRRKITVMFTILVMLPSRSWIVTAEPSEWRDCQYCYSGEC